MGIANIPNPEAVNPNFFRPGWFIGWHIGWWTGWWNPFDVVKEIDPREVGVLTIAQGEFLARQAEVLRGQAELVKQMGQQIANVRGGGPAGGGAGGKG
jgi:hypothetical protein